MQKLMSISGIIVLTAAVAIAVFSMSIGPIEGLDLHVNISPQDALCNILERSLRSDNGLPISLTLSDKEVTELLKYYISECIKQDDIKIAGIKVIFEKDRAIFMSNLILKNRKIGVQLIMAASSPQNLEFEISSLKLGFIHAPPEFLFGKLLKGLITDKFFTVQNNRIKISNIENYQFKLDNILFSEGYMTAVISAKNEDFNSKMLKIFIEMMEKLSPEERQNIIRKLFFL